MVAGKQVMSSTDTMIKNQPVYSPNSSAKSADIVMHPARTSMAQQLAGTGALVFEGELLEMPLQWHPTGTRH